MKRMVSIACLVLAVAALQACTVIQSAQWVVARYCSLPEPARSVNREAAALAVAPNRIRVECVGDE